MPTVKDNERITMKLTKLFSEIEIKKTNVDVNIDITGISEKSASCKSGYIYVCLKGTRKDGIDFIQEALDNGAICVVCDRELDESIPYVIVENARAALSRLWQEWYGHPARSLKLIGVTGTNGKTSTAYMLKSILDKSGKPCGLIGTVRYITGAACYESVLTTPDPEIMQKLLYEMKESGHEYVVCEVSSHSLALDKLDGMHFEIGIFTNLTQDHMDFHENMENYFMAKYKLFSMCNCAVINSDDIYGKRLASKLNIKTVTCSVDSNDADICAKNIRTKENSVEYEFLSGLTIYRIYCPVSGKFSVYNSLLSAATAELLGVKAEDIVSGISSMGMVMGRMERVETGKDFSIIIDFAHTPGALENVLKSIREFAPGRIVCLFGCGGDRDRSKRKIMGKIAAENADYLVITSDNPRSEDPLDIIKEILEGVVSVESIKDKYTVIVSREEAIRYAIRNAEKDDTILLAGKGHENYYIDASGKHDFDERSIIKDELSK